MLKSKYDEIVAIVDDVRKRIVSEEEALKAVRTIIKYIGDDPNRGGLEKTPARVLKAWKNDWGLGYDKNYIAAQTASILNGQFDDGAENYSEMILVRNIKFHSNCEHHLAPFGGTCVVGYIPRKKGGRILGLSKLVRVVDMFSRKLQVQERLTKEIADFINEKCKPLGVGVIMKATHGCMLTRGVRQDNTDAITSALRGEMYTKPEVRAEFLHLAGIK